MKISDIRKLYKPKKNVTGVNCTLVYLQTPDENCSFDSPTDEIIVGFIILFLVLFTYGRFYHVWSTKLNFNAVSTYIYISIQTQNFMITAGPTK